MPAQGFLALKARRAALVLGESAVFQRNLGGIPKLHPTCHLAQNTGVLRMASKSLVKSGTMSLSRESKEALQGPLSALPVAPLQVHRTEEASEQTWELSGQLSWSAVSTRVSPILSPDSLPCEGSASSAQSPWGQGQVGSMGPLLLQSSN